MKGKIKKNLKFIIPRNFFRERYISKFITDKKFAERIFSLYFSGEDIFKNKEVRILDFGCSLGRMGAILSNLGFKNIDCYDIQEYETWVRIKKEYQNVNFYTNLKDITNKKYDIILAIIVIEYIQNYQETLKILSNLLVKDGLFFGFFVNKESFWHKVMKRKTGPVIYQEFNFEELEKIFKKIGLSISKVHYEGFRIPFINRLISFLVPLADTLSNFSKKLLASF